MKAPTVRFATLIGALTFAIFLATMALVISRPARLPEGIEAYEPILFLLEESPFLVFAALGVLIARRHPENPIGWMFTAIGFLVLFASFAAEYALYALDTNPGSLPAGAVMAWASLWVWLVGAGLIVLIILLIPNGRLASHRWRPLAWLVVADTATLALSAAVLLWPYRGLELVIGLEDTTVSPVAESIVFIGFPILLVSLLPATVSMLLRFRRARGDERQQLKWVAYGAGVLVVSQVFTGGSAATGINIGDTPSLLVDTIGILAVPVAMGVAVLRYRLYDIDVIINRTLVYGGLTVVLGLVYVGGIFALGELLRSVSGQEDNNLAVAGSTLAVAALFRPARARFQNFIDRRFYRRKYDAARTLQEFSARLRDEVELDVLTTDLMTVVNDTMQPARASLWLRGT